LVGSDLRTVAVPVLGCFLCGTSPGMVLAARRTASTFGRLDGAVAPLCNARWIGFDHLPPSMGSDCYGRGYGLVLLLDWLQGISIHCLSQSTARHLLRGLYYN